MKQLFVLCVLLCTGYAIAQPLAGSACNKEGATVQHMHCNEGVWQRPQDLLRSKSADARFDYFPYKKAVSDAPVIVDSKECLWAIKEDSKQNKLVIFRLTDKANKQVCRNKN